MKRYISMWKEKYARDVYPDKCADCNMYINVHVFIYIHIYIYVYIGHVICALTPKEMYILTNMRTAICVYMYMYIYIRIYVYMYPQATLLVHSP